MLTKSLRVMARKKLCRHREERCNRGHGHGSVSVSITRPKTGHAPGSAAMIGRLGLPLTVNSVASTLFLDLVGLLGVNHTVAGNPALPYPAQHSIATTPHYTSSWTFSKPLRLLIHISPEHYATLTPSLRIHSVHCCSAQIQESRSDETSHYGILKPRSNRRYTKT